MTFLETLFYYLEEEPEPNTPEYRENLSVTNSLMEKVQNAMGADMAEKIKDIYAEREEMECYRYFLHGICLGLELLRLSV